jgi:hypothetical protein
LAASSAKLIDRRSDYDVTNAVRTTEVASVAAEVRNIYVDLFRKSGAQSLVQPFHDFEALYSGEFPGYRACDTGYHDVQHVLDVTLAMARLMDGYKQAGREPLDERFFRLGVVLALFHDCGYIRGRADSRHKNGAEYTLIHVTRSARFLRSYLPSLGMADLAELASRLVHFTGYETPVESIRIEQPIQRVIGNLLGSADIIAQMADRCYLEKCYDRLYPEFMLGGIARRRTSEGEKVIFESAADLIAKTPGFYQSAAKRLDQALEGAYHYAESHFGGRNLYVEAVEKNMRYARVLTETNSISSLRRRPPKDAAGARQISLL